MCLLLNRFRPDESSSRLPLPSSPVSQSFYIDAAAAALKHINGRLVLVLKSNFHKSLKDQFDIVLIAVITKEIACHENQSRAGASYYFIQLAITEISTQIIQFAFWPSKIHQKSILLTFIVL